MGALFALNRGTSPKRLSVIESSTVSEEEEGEKRVAFGGPEKALLLRHRSSTIRTT